MATEMSRRDSTKRALEHGVIRSWSGVRPSPKPTDEVLARIAVHEVVQALRYNPAWAKSLGIGE